MHTRESELDSLGFKIKRILAKSLFNKHFASRMRKLEARAHELETSGKKRHRRAALRTRASLEELRTAQRALRFRWNELEIPLQLVRDEIDNVGSIVHVHSGSRTRLKELYKLRGLLESLQRDARF